MQRYNNEHSDLNLFGGIINVANGMFYLNSEADYEFGDGKSGQVDEVFDLKKVKKS